MSSLANDYYGFRSSLGARGIILSFTGFVSETILFSLGEALKQKMTLDATDRQVIKRVFSVFVEQAQNIIRYSADRVSGDIPRPVAMSSGIISVGLEEDRFFVVCANTIRRADAPRLKERLEYIASLDKDGLKAYYKEKLKEPPEEGSVGASIGLIEIARRASEPIAFDFLDLDDDSTFFCLKTYV